MVGSPQGDTIVGDGDANRLDGGVGNDDLDSGGGGGDQPSAAPAATTATASRSKNSCGPEPGPPPGGAYAILNQGLDGSSLVVQGGARQRRHPHLPQRPGLDVSDGARIFAGDGCVSVTSNASAVGCAGDRAGR